MECKSRIQMVVWILLFVATKKISASGSGESSA
jgi:hypothetical protein